jgi:acyl carrier protein
MTVEAQIRDYLNEYLLFIDDPSAYGNDDSFLGRNLIDSTTVMELVFFVEDQFGIQVGDEEITPSNFDSVNQLARYIRAKQLN